MKLITETAGKETEPYWLFSFQKNARKCKINKTLFARSLDNKKKYLIVSSECWFADPQATISRTEGSLGL